MSSYIATKVGRRIVGQNVASLEPVDPHYETYTDDRGKSRSRKRPLPEGLSKRDQRILQSVRRRAHYLDKGFSLCGFRFGWSAIFGLIPFLGDIVAFMLGYFLVFKKCQQAEIPLVLQQKMAFNSAVSIGCGMIPLVGDVILAVWKANSRNAALLEEYLIQRVKKGGASGTEGVGSMGGVVNGKSSTDDQMAQNVIAGSKISKSTGEPVPFTNNGVIAGTTQHEKQKPVRTNTPLSNASNHIVNTPTPTTTTAATPLNEQAGEGAAAAKTGKSFYGWGGGTNEKKEL